VVNWSEHFPPLGSLTLTQPGDLAPAR
jgi:hypothetical protein